jgi:ParB family chromosome partitioning protein
MSPPRPRALGRGLDALLSQETAASTPAETAAGDRLAELPLSALQPGRYQPRTQMDADAIASLAASLKAQGMIQPILVRPLAAGRHEIIAGERRWRAAAQAGFETVPVVVRDVPDESALAMALIENIQREGLNALEEAAGLQRLVDEFGMTHEAAAAAVGRSRTAVSNLLRLLQLPRAVQQLLHDQRLEMGHARALLPLDEANQLALAHRAAVERLSVRQVEQLVAQTARAAATRKPAPPARSRDVENLETELADRLGTGVRIVERRGGRGRLVIEYASLDQLDDVLTRLRG